MKALEIARKLASLGQVEKACEAYALTLYQNAGTDPDVQMESAVYILRMGGNYKVAYTAFVDLYAKGHFQKECMEILTESFYEPNVALMKSRYKKNQFWN